MESEEDVVVLVSFLAPVRFRTFSYIVMSYRDKLVDSVVNIEWCTVIGYGNSVVVGVEDRPLMKIYVLGRRVNRCGSRFGVLND